MHVESLMKEAVQRHREGSIKSARELYLRVIDSCPDHPDALNLLGVINFQTGKPDDAIEKITEAIKINPFRPDFYHNLGSAFRAKGLCSKAIECFRKAISLKPKDPEVYLALGTLLEDQGKFDEAIACYHDVLQLNPNAVRIWQQLGNIYLLQKAYWRAIRCYQSALKTSPDLSSSYNGMGVSYKEIGYYPRAAAAYRRAIQLSPDCTQFHFNLGYVYAEMGQYVEAIQSFKRALAIKPQWPDALHNLGNAYFQLNMVQEAISCYLLSLKHDANVAETYNGLGCAYREQGKSHEAINCFYRSLALKPNFAMAGRNLGLELFEQDRIDRAEEFFQKILDQQPRFETEVLMAMLHPLIFDSTNAIAQHRQSFQNKLTQLAASGQRLEDPFVQVGLTNFRLGMHGCREREIREQIARFYLKVCPHLSWESPKLNKHSKENRIHIGFVSRFLCEHTIGRLYHGLIEHMSKDKFRISVFHINPRQDAISKKIDQCADQVVLLPKNLSIARELIAEQKLDVLFFPELGMDPLTYFLAFSRLAPVQCKRGYQITMGIPTVDYFISSQWGEPDDAQSHYSEKLVLLKTTGYYYLRPEMPRMIFTRSQLGLPEDKHIYACLQSLFKIHPDFDAVLGRILQADPDGVLVLMQGKHKHWQNQLMQRFKKNIPEVAKRIYFLPPMPREKFMTLFLIADAVLDTIHISGGNTSLECFAWGVPVVTWPGPYLPGRLTYGFYKQMNVLDCVVKNLQDYADLAVRLANDRAWHATVSNKIKAHSGLLFEDERAVRELERFFEWAVDRAYGQENRRSF